ncbi:unnamed protein product, partial [Polarella glacialis]
VFTSRTTSGSVEDDLLGPGQLLIREEDEEDIYAAIAQLPYRIKKLKPGGRELLPESGSLLNVSSMSSSSSSAMGSDQPEFSNAANSFSLVSASGDALLRGEGEFVVTVRRTFIHLQPEASLDTRSVASF